MKIAVVASFENVGISSVESLYLAEYVEHLRDLNHEVTLLAGDDVTLPFSSAAQGISIVRLEMPSAVISERYASTNQSFSDQILATLYREYEHHIFDVVEFLGRGGLAAAAIRAKKTWGLFENVKFTVHTLGLNTLFDQLDPKSVVSSERLLMTSLETYACRYADVVSTPILKVKDFLKSSVGRFDVQLSSFWFDKGMDEAVSGDENFRKLFESNGGSNESTLSVEEVLSVPAKKIISSSQSKTLTLYIEYRGCGHEESLTRFQNSGLNLEVIYFALEGSSHDSFASFSPEIGEKFYDPISSVNELFTQGQGDYVVFVQDPAVLSYSYLESAVGGLQRNPMLGWVGCYIGGDEKYPLGYVPNLTSFRNTCPAVGAVYCRPALERLMESREILFRNGFEWEIFVGLNEKYVNGDVIPHVFFTRTVSNSCEVTAKELVHTVTLSRGQNTADMLTLLLEEPELLEPASLSVDMDVNREEFRVIDFIDSDEENHDGFSSIETPVFENNSEDLTVANERSEDGLGILDEKPEEETNDEPEESLKIRFDEGDNSEEPESESENSFQATEEETILDEPRGLKLKMGFSNDSSNDSSETVADVSSSEESPVSEIEKPLVHSNAPSFQVFWSKDWGFSEETSLREESEDGDHLYREFKVSSETEVNTLRIDPCDCEGRVYLRRIQIVDETTGFTIFSASEENAFDNIRPAGDFEVEGIEGDALVLCSTGADPQVLIELLDVELTQFTLQIEYGLNSLIRFDKNLRPEEE